MVCFVQAEAIADISARGTHPLNHVKVVICGSAGAGKTATLRSLLHPQLPFEQPLSTIGVEETVVEVRAAFNTDGFRKVDQTQERERESQQLERTMARHVLDQMRSRDARAGEAVGPSVAGQSKPPPPPPPMTPAQPATAREGAPTAKRVAVDASLVQSLVQEYERTGDKDWPVVVSFMDLGGQDLFFSFHRLFVSSIALYLIVFSMEDVLSTDRSTKEKALEHVRQWINVIKVSWLRVCV